MQNEHRPQLAVLRLTNTWEQGDNRDMQTQGGDDEKDRYRTCCAVCHIKFGTVVLGVIEMAVCIAVLISAAQQVVWKTGGSQHCSDNTPLTKPSFPPNVNDITKY
ncbi:hypothetical protein ANCCEY_12639 [Ancylostoma ceylanicum]|uniref:Uncharacterized protein n=1 Tax=Ancylostoma ceylanicum TaxID=53326 RepID=A0A0D6LKW9_9BILA|nr:hypothetical protein ANCCEY_12639 [Ancylostoma ceylanicum]